MHKKPMLACPAPSDLQYPLLASAKLDGIRCTVWSEQPMTRALKPIPNTFVRETIRAAKLPAVFDGELVVGPANAPDVYTRTTSGIMSRDGTPDFSLWVFDYVPQLADRESFSYRWGRLVDRTSAIRAFHPWFRVLPHEWVRSHEELLRFEQRCIAEGFEGVILRHPDAPYKHGRSTAKEQGMMKVKRFDDTELEVVGVVELNHNDNEAVTNELGHTQRSTAKAGLRPAGVLGALVCKWQDTTVEVGTGFTAAQRAELWQEGPGRLIGRLVKVKYFAHGMVDKPRHPVFLGFRDPDDL